MPVVEATSRAAALALLVSLVLGAGCPLRQSDREPDGEVWEETVLLRVGQSADVDGGALEVTLAALRHGNRISDVTIRLAKPDGGSVEETVEAVRNARLSKAVRLEPYAVRVFEYPGVDSARLVVTRE